uniref:nucleoside 2-deoxyribosyltransferase n=1 Tax=Clostridium sp. 12(A) TaxID=1163671 RepID=UPI00046517D2|nr:nucleoside 2-deoxyribosyltransferase [Clostridium sp. 12(A)]
MKHVWLCGASEKVSFENGNKWREDCAKWFENNSEYFKAWNPNNYYNYNQHLHKTDLEIIRFCDKHVEQADVILVNLKDIRKSVGSVSELAWGYSLKKPIVGFIEDDTFLDFHNCKKVEEALRKEIHPWVYEYCGRIEAGFDARLDALEYIDKYYGE